MFCKNCGTEVKEGAKFCPKCGSQITAEKKSEKVSQSYANVRAAGGTGAGININLEDKTKIAVIIGVVALGVVLAALILVIRARPKQPVLVEEDIALELVDERLPEPDIEDIAVSVDTDTDTALELMVPDGSAGVGFKLDGLDYQFPCKVSELFITGRYEWEDLNMGSTMIESYSLKDFFIVHTEKDGEYGDEKFSIKIYNPFEVSKPAEDCYLCAISPNVPFSYILVKSSLCTSEGVAVGDSIETCLQLLGKPSKFEDFKYEWLTRMDNNIVYRVEIYVNSDRNIDDMRFVYWYNDFFNYNKYGDYWYRTSYDMDL